MFLQVLLMVLLVREWMAIEMEQSPAWSNTVLQDPVRFDVGEGKGRLLKP